MSLRDDKRVRVVGRAWVLGVVIVVVTGVLNVVFLRTTLKKEAFSPERARVGPASDERLLVFVGGLQRSGTTAAVDAVERLFFSASKQEARLLNESFVVPRQGQSKSYFKDVVKSGGLEGKFLQDVYPYKYFLRDWGLGESVLALDVASATPEKAQELWRQWRPFWDVSRRIFIEKTPENIVSGPYFQKLFDGATFEGLRFRTAFVFVLRHPLPWSLAIEKWLENKHNRKKTTHLRSALENRVDMWLRVTYHLFDKDAQLLNRLKVFHAELADTDPSLLAKLLDMPLANENVNDLSFRGYRDANDAYATCWLHGGTYLSTKKHCQPNMGNKKNRTSDLRRLKLRFETSILAFGYSMDFEFGDNRNKSLTHSNIRPDAIDPRYRRFFLLPSSDRPFP